MRTQGRILVIRFVCPSHLRRYIASSTCANQLWEGPQSECSGSCGFVSLMIRWIRCSSTWEEALAQGRCMNPAAILVRAQEPSLDRLPALPHVLQRPFVLCLFRPGIILRTAIPRCQNNIIISVLARCARTHSHCCWCLLTAHSAIQLIYSVLTILLSNR